MSEEHREQIVQFAYSLGQATGFATRALAEEEMLAEFAARGISRADLVEFIESAKRVANFFYATPQPI